VGKAATVPVSRVTRTQSAMRGQIPWRDIRGRLSLRECHEKRKLRFWSKTRAKSTIKLASLQLYTTIKRKLARHAKTRALKPAMNPRSPSTVWKRLSVNWFGFKCHKARNKSTYPTENAKSVAKKGAVYLKIPVA